MKKWLTQIFEGSLKWESQDIEDLRLGLLKIKQSKNKIAQVLAPMPELNDHQYNVDVWSFESIVNDKLEQKGWAIAANENNDTLLTHAFRLLTFESNFPAVFKKMVERYSKNTHLHRSNMAFILAHKNDLWEVAEALENFTPADLLEKHTAIIHSNVPERPAPDTI